MVHLRHLAPQPRVTGAISAADLPGERAGFCAEALIDLSRSRPGFLRQQEFLRALLLAAALPASFSGADRIAERLVARFAPEFIIASKATTKFAISSIRKAWCTGSKCHPRYQTTRSFGRGFYRTAETRRNSRKAAYQ